MRNARATTGAWGEPHSLVIRAAARDISEAVQLRREICWVGLVDCIEARGTKDSSVGASALLTAYVSVYTIVASARIMGLLDTSVCSEAANTDEIQFPITVDGD